MSGVEHTSSAIALKQYAFYSEGGVFGHTILLTTNEQVDTKTVLGAVS